MSQLVSKMFSTFHRMLLIYKMTMLENMYVIRTVHLWHKMLVI